MLDDISKNSTEPTPSELGYLKSRLEYLEEERRSIGASLDDALSLGDFQEAVRSQAAPVQIVSECETRIRRIMEFDTCAIFLVNEKTMDLDLWLCSPPRSSFIIEDEINFMIFEGFVAWAIREHRGITVPSKKLDNEVMLHVMATSARIRGLFIGVFPPGRTRNEDIPLQLLSIILRSTANALESVEYCRAIREQKHELEKKVNEKAKKLLDYERQLQRAQKMEALGTLAGGVAHDLNNVLTGMVSYPDLLLMQLPEDSPFRRPIKTIRESGQKAAAIVQDLLTLARRGIKNNVIVFNINNVVNEYLKSPELDRLRSQYPSMQITTDLDSDLLNIKGSPIHLHKTVMNLVTNAAEALQEIEKIHISTFNCYVDVPYKGYEEVHCGEYAVLCVADSGEGISSEDRERIFEPFYTKKAMGRSGTGLGMSVVWGTVKDHGGYIDVESSPGAGTNITLYFPAVREKLISEPEGITPSVDYMGRGESILVVDDIEEQREIAKTILTELGYRVETAAGGETAVDMTAVKQYDLIVLDMIMDPGIDGFETYMKICRNRPGQKAIISSGFSETQRVREAKRFGVGGYVKKPYTIESLGVAVRKTLDQKI